MSIVMKRSGVVEDLGQMEQHQLAVLGACKSDQRSNEILLAGLMPVARGF